MSDLAASKRFLSCDWGTTRLRLRLVERATDTVLAEYSSDDGVARLAGTPPAERPDAFRQALTRAVHRIADEQGAAVCDLPIVISGMASSSIGWYELPYAALPLALDGSDLVWQPLGQLDADHAGEVALISGLASDEDVMRGEEIEAIGAARLLSGGALAGEAVLILPGTHSKHVHFRAGHIVGFRTFMTGELFEVLSSHSVLQHSVRQPVLSGVLSIDPLAARPDWRAPVISIAFDEGARLGAALPLATALFQVRTRALLAKWSAADCSQLLSGILIASELSGLSQSSFAGLPLVLAAPPATSESYRRAALALGLAPRLTVLPPADLARLAVVGQSLALAQFLATEK